MPVANTIRPLSIEPQDIFRDNLATYAAEERHFAADATAAHADLVVDGAAEAGDDRYRALAGPTGEDGVGA